MGRCVTFIVPVEPVPQPRHRTTRTGRHYLPTSHPIHGFKLSVQAAALNAGVMPIAGAVRVDIVAVFTRPKSHLGRDGVPKPSAPPYPGHGCGDWDNLAKGVCDALKGLAWGDDTQVVDGRTRKRYAVANEPGHVSVTLEEA